MDSLKGATLIKADGSNVEADSSLEGKKEVAFYFSAHWCPPCRQFTPMLKDAYDEYLEEAKDIEIVFVSSDRSLDDMKKYMEEAHGNWLAMQHNSELGKELKAKFGISTIPALIVCKADGTIITKDGRNEVAKAGPEAM